MIGAGDCAALTVGGSNELDAVYLERLDCIFCKGAKSLNAIERSLLRNLAFNRRARPDVLSVDHRLVDARYVERMHGHGYRIFCWTVNEPAEMRRLIGLGVDGIITDRPDLLLLALEASTKGD